MQVAEARSAFISWNKACLDDFLESLPPAQQLAFDLLPLLFQTNNRLLPGYNGLDTPAGIYGYKPEKSALKAAKSLNRRFSYEQLAALKNTLIESIFIQQQLIEERLTIWIIHVEKLKQDQYDELNDKLQRVLIWLKSRDLVVNAYLVSSQDLAAKHLNRIDNVSAEIFLDEFYSQSILLAGKYPLWWLVPDEKQNEYPEFVEHIKQARFVNQREFVDLGNTAPMIIDDVLQQILTQMSLIGSQPEKSWLRLLLLTIQYEDWPELLTSSRLLKRQLYSTTDAYDSLLPRYLYRRQLEDAIDRVNVENMSARHLLTSLKKVSRHDLPLFVSTADTANQKLVENISSRYDLSEYIAIYNDLQRLTQYLVSQLLSELLEKPDAADADIELDYMCRNVIEYLQYKDNRIPVFNFRERPEFVLGRVLFRFDQNARDWHLVIEQEDEQDKVIQTSKSLLGLIAWLWLNRLADISTQVSIDCPMDMAKQIELRHALEVLIDKINQDLVKDLSPQAFMVAKSPVCSIMFVNNLQADRSLAQSLAQSSVLGVNAELLIVSNWGDVVWQPVLSEQDFLGFICEWLSNVSLSGDSLAKGFQVFSYSAGDATDKARRYNQIYQQIVECFFQKRSLDRQFIINSDGEYYCISQIDDAFRVDALGDEEKLYKYLAKPNAKFIDTQLELLSQTDTPLREIYQKNYPGQVQIFFQVKDKQCFTWLLDEKGSLWYARQPWFGGSSYIAHWLYLIRNVRKKLQENNYLDAGALTIKLEQVVENISGEKAFKAVGVESVKADAEFIDVRLVLDGGSKGQFNLLCEEKEFNYLEYGDGVVEACGRYIQGIQSRQDKKPVYITEINAPIGVYGIEQQSDVQFVRLLKYKSYIEEALNQ